MAEAQRYHGARKAAVACVGALVVMWWWTRRPFRLAVDGASMSPTLVAGDLLMATAPGRLRRGELLVVEHPLRPGFELIKRLGGLPGDRVDGRVLADDEFWVVGDLPARSTDSRSFGAISRSSIRGVVRLRYWPPSRLRYWRLEAGG
jgi:signal peptidase I